MFLDPILAKLVNEQTVMFNDPESTVEEREKKHKEIRKRQEELRTQK